MGVGQVFPCLHVGTDRPLALGQLDGPPGMLLRWSVRPLVEEAEGEVALYRRRLVQGLGPVGVQRQKARDELLRLGRGQAGDLAQAEAQRDAAFSLSLRGALPLPQAGEGKLATSAAAS